MPIPVVAEVDLVILHVVHVTELLIEDLGQRPTELVRHSLQFEHEVGPHLAHEVVRVDRPAQVAYYRLWDEVDVLLER